MTNAEKIERLQQEMRSRLTELHQQETYGNVRRKQEITRELAERRAEQESK